NILSSKRYFDNSSNNLGDLLLQNAISNVTLTKTWEGTPNSLTANYYRDQNLQTGELNQRIPSVNFTRSQSFPFRGKSTSLLDLKWYEVISYSYSAQLLNNQTKRLQTDTSNNKFFVKDSRGGIKQFAQISAPFKFDLINISPFFNYNEVWHNKYVEKTFNQLDSTVITTDKSAIKTFRFFNTGISMNTRIIGIFNTNFFGVKGFRHTILPTVTYSYQPDFKKSFWDIYGSYIDASGRKVFYNKFEREVFGSAPGDEVQSLNFSMDNVFEMKTRATDTTENKFQILNLGAGISYNFVADSLKLSELGLNYRTQVADLLNIGGSASFNFYKYVGGIGRINQFLINTDKKFADLTNFNINLSTSLRGEKTSSADTVKKQESEEDEYVGIYGDEPPDFTIPWEVTLNYNYGINKSNPFAISKISNLSGSLSFSLTQKWKFTFSASYDIFQKQFSAPYITIYRDLHCWEMNFNWIPLGTYRGFRFELRIKAPQLQDIKVTKQTNFRGVY
ncbi:MAG: putative LPS assembly protein LptD, partial [Ignavibacteria bacterium]